MTRLRSSEPTSPHAEQPQVLGEATAGRKKSQQALESYLSDLFPMRAEPDAPSSGAAGAEMNNASQENEARDVGKGSGASADGSAMWIERSRIEPNPAQPRRTWSEASLRELGESLKRDGQLQACVVRPHPSKVGFFQLVSGERRWRASAPEFANLELVRATIRAVSDDESMRLALVENLQREDLNDIDKARAFVDLRASLSQSDPRVTWSHVGEMVGLSREHLQRLKALLALPLDVQEAVRGGALSGRSARVLTGLKDAALQSQLAREIQERHLSSDQALERARVLSSNIPVGIARAGNSTSTSTSAINEPLEPADAWEKSLREAVRMLERARGEAESAGRGKAGKKARRLLERARSQVEAIAREVG